MTSATAGKLIPRPAHRAPPTSRRNGCRDDRDQRVPVERGAAHERAVDIRLREDLGGVVGLHAAAVEDAHPRGRRAERSPTQRPDEADRLLGGLGGGDHAGADRPDRLVRDHHVAQALDGDSSAGKPVIVSMGTLAASGGYYISCFADRIVAEPGTLTGSIGVLTGKVSFGKSAGLLGVGVNQIGVGKNALMDSVISPYTDEQLADLNHQADVVYADFLQKVATGRKLPLQQVQDVAKGRVWTGADAKGHGLVDELGGFWTAVAEAKKLTGIAANQDVSFKIYPKRAGFFAALSSAFSGTAAGVRAMQGLAAVEQLPVARAILGSMVDSAETGVRLKADNLPLN